MVYQKLFMSRFMYREVKVRQLLILWVFFIFTGPALAGDNYKPQSNISLLRSLDAGYMIIGTTHTNEVNDLQLVDIENLFYELNPSLILLEGGFWPDSTSQSAAVECCGEMGFIQFLAKKNNVKVSTWEGDSLSEAQFILDKFDSESVKIFYLLRQAPQLFNHANLAEATEKMKSLLGESGFPAQEYQILSKPHSIEQLNSMLSAMVGKTISWNEFTTADIFDAQLNTVEFSKFQAIKDRVNEFRDLNAVTKLKTALANKERVIFIGGQLHFVPVMNAIIKP
jgi:hypothetical protein